jgi:hypothetical protein
LFEELLDVAGAGAGAAAEAAAVEAGEVDVADGLGGRRGRRGARPWRRGKLLDADLVAGDGMVRRRPSGFLTVRRTSVPFLPPDEADDVVRRISTTSTGLVVGLGDHEDDVFGFEVALSPAGAAGDDADDLDVVLFDAEDGADAFEFSAHLDVEVFFFGGREPLAVGVKLGDEGAEEGVEVLGVSLGVKAREACVIVFGELLACAGFEVLVGVGVGGAGLGAELVGLLEALHAFEGLELEDHAPGSASAASSLHQGRLSPSVSRDSSWVQSKGFVRRSLMMSRTARGALLEEVAAGACEVEVAVVELIVEEALPGAEGLEVGFEEEELRGVLGARCSGRGP